VTVLARDYRCVQLAWHITQPSELHAFERQIFLVVAIASFFVQCQVIVENISVCGAARCEAHIIFVPINAPDHADVAFALIPGWVLHRKEVENLD